VKPCSKLLSAPTPGSAQAECLTAYVAPESNRGSVINELIALFDSPAQREAQMLEAQALGEAWQEHRPGGWPKVQHFAFCQRCYPSAYPNRNGLTR
jgi:hypothetical protein